MKITLDDPQLTRCYELELADDATDEHISWAGKALRTIAYLTDARSIDQGWQPLCNDVEGFRWLTIYTAEDEADPARLRCIFPEVV